MSDRSSQRESRVLRAGALAGLALALGTVLPAAAGGPGVTGNPHDQDGLYVPPPIAGAVEQVAQLRGHGTRDDADRIQAMLDTPTAVWFTAGTAAEVRQAVHTTVTRAVAKRTVPVLVSYDIPFRDCAQFSAGGATSTDEYLDWIDGFAAGIGDAEAIVILEPDSLGIIPWYRPFGGALEWCQPAEADPETAAADRFDQLNRAIDRLAEQPGVSVYLDATHSAWLGAGDIADRLAKAGVGRTRGFFLNVSNFQYTANLTQYGSWISACLAYGTQVAPGDFGSCPNQYWNGGPDGTAIADLLGAWTGVALSNYGEWSDTSTDPALNTSGINWRYASMLGSVEATTPFVIDTSRNGLGPWNPGDHPAGDPQDWCNPPDRGTGPLPAAGPAPLVDAYLWVKIPGASDGQCNRWSPAGSPDPVRGIVDPPAGAWFPEMALELARNANP
jgi:endoglucanase